MGQVGTTIKGWISSLWTKLKSGIDLQNGWIPFINSQLKWVFALGVRIGAIILILLAIKYLGIMKSLRGLVMGDMLGIKQESVDVISSPDIKYDTDLVSIDDVIKMLESKKSQKEKKDEKKTK